MTVNSLNVSSAFPSLMKKEMGEKKTTVKLYDKRIKPRF